MKNSEIAKVFQDIADLLELKGENQFKIRAYQKAVRSIEHLPVEVEQLAADNRLREVPGVGEAIAKKITELVTTGKLNYYEELKSEFPEGISTSRPFPDKAIPIPVPRRTRISTSSAGTSRSCKVILFSPGMPLSL